MNKIDIAAYNKAVGRRFVEARGLAGLSQIRLANAIDVEKGLVCRVELGIDVGEGVPGWVLHRAAVACGVKTDFLLGLTAESEPDEPGPTFREVAHLSNVRAVREREEHALETALLHERVSAFRELAASMDAAAQAVQADLQRVADLNPGWEDMKAGARLAASVEALHDAVGCLGRRSSRHVVRGVVDEASQTIGKMENALA